MKILYISYDGMTDPLGQSQVLPYLRLLASKGYSFTLISYEKEKNFGKHEKEIRDAIRDYDITWVPMRYTRNPPVLSTIMDLSKGKRMIRELMRNLSFDIVHCRGYIAALLGLWCKKKYGTRFIFDMRGWWADEKLESGNWNGPLYGIIYRYFKKKEKAFFRQSDFAVSLTHAGKDYMVKNKLKEGDKIAVIPTCVDFGLFGCFDPAVRTAVRNELRIPRQATVLLYSGSMGGNYRNDLIFGIFRSQLKRDPSSILLLLTPTDKAYVLSELQKFGVSLENVVVRNCRYAEMSRYLMAGDCGLVFYDQRFSALGRSPTKLGEYWASGLPFISTTGIGDLELLNSRWKKSSFLLEEINEEAFRHALDQLLTFTDEEKKGLYNLSKENFDLGKGTEIYSGMYRSCMGLS